MELLIINNLTKIFNPKSSWFSRKDNYSRAHVAVKNISFSLKEGEIVGLIGGNGAGKSTLLHMLIGILTPTSGSIYYFGKDFSKNRSTLFQYISFASSSFKLVPSLTVIQNLTFFAQIYMIPDETRYQKINYLLSMFELADYKHKRIADLSTGQSNKVSILKAFIPNAKIVLLDEPTAFLDTKTAELVRNLIKKQRSQTDTTFLLTTHNQQDITELCDRVFIMENGHVREDVPLHYVSTPIGTLEHDETILLSTALEDRFDKF